MASLSTIPATAALASPIASENSQITVRPSVSTEAVEIEGVKKDLLVWALRNGGDLLDNVLDLVSDSAGDYLKKYAGQIADFLDSITNSFEARLIDFMIFELGFPSSVARSIAWALSTFLL